MLSCKELSVEIGPQKVRILDRATAQFKGNALNAVIGPSGCGKTTLVKAMLGIYRARVKSIMMVKPFTTVLIFKVNFLLRLSSVLRMSY